MPNDGEVFANNYLEHFGIKGMRWGFRKDKSNGGIGVDSTSVTIKTAPGRIEVSGGRGRMPSADAVQATMYRQIAKASSTHALSNKEIRIMVERINLEQQYAQAVQKNSSGGARGKAVGWVASKLSKAGDMFVDTAMKIQVNQIVQQTMNTKKPVKK